MKFFLSNSVDHLCATMIADLFAESPSPLHRFLMIIPHRGVEGWLQEKFAFDSRCGIAMGVDYLQYPACFTALSSIFEAPSQGSVPTLFELGVAIETILRETDASGTCSEKSMALATRFQEYGREQPELLQRWECGEELGEQAQLWRELRQRFPAWRLFGADRAIPKRGRSLYTVVLFCLPSLTPQELGWLQHLGETVAVAAYFFSPCALFWSDVCSRKEQSRILALWETKLGTAHPQLFAMEELLDETHPLLGSWGREARRLARLLEQEIAQVASCYRLPKGYLAFNDEIGGEDCYDFSGQEDLVLPPTLLSVLQGDLLTLAHRKGKTIEWDQDDGSIAVHAASHRFREVEVIYEQILRRLEKDPTLFPSDILILLRDAHAEVVAFNYYFSEGRTPLSLAWIGGAPLPASSVVHPLLRWVEWSCARGREISSLLLLIRHPSFVPSWCDGTFRTAWVKYLENAHARWGRDAWQQCATEEGPAGWRRFSQIVEKCLSTELHSCRTWVKFFAQILEECFVVDPYERERLEQLLDLTVPRDAACAAECVAWSSWAIRFASLLKEETLPSFDAGDRQSIRIAPLAWGRFLPAKIVVMMGMQDGEFPTGNSPLPWDHLGRTDRSGEKDRALFLEAIHMAREALIMSYCKIGSQGEGESALSSVVQELLEALDAGHTIGGKPASQVIVQQHPFDADLEVGASMHRSQSVEVPWMDRDLWRRIARPLPDRLHLTNLMEAFSHPLKAFLKHRFSVRLDDADVDSHATMHLLSPLEKWRCRRSLFGQTVSEIGENALDAMLEQRCTNAAVHDLRKSAVQQTQRELQEALARHSLGRSDFFDLKLDPHCFHPYSMNDGSWCVPPLVVPTPSGRVFQLCGTLPQVSRKGIWLHGKGGVAESWKREHLLLVYQAVVDRDFPEWEKQLFLSSWAQPRPLSHDNPLARLPDWIECYERAMQEPSPLFPDWIEPICGSGEALRQLLKEVHAPLHAGMYKELLWLFDLTEERLERWVAEWRSAALALKESL